MDIEAIIKCRDFDYFFDTYSYGEHERIYFQFIHHAYFNAYQNLVICLDNMDDSKKALADIRDIIKRLIPLFGNILRVNNKTGLEFHSQSKIFAVALREHSLRGWTINKIYVGDKFEDKIPVARYLPVFDACNTEILRN